jgi:hypothetical protein
MSCSLQDRMDSGINNAMSVFVRNSKFETQDNKVVMRVSPKFTKNQLYLIAQKNAERVSAWAEKQYGSKFKFGWTQIDESMWDTVIVRFRVPPALASLFQVQDDIITIEEANKQLALPDVGNDFFMGDSLLREQWNRENESESEYLNELMSTTTERTAYSENKKEWQYNKNKEVKQLSLFDDTLFDDLYNEQNKC